jgi:K+-transporting ATPase KdpF subunit
MLPAATPNRSPRERAERVVTGVESVVGIVLAILIAAYLVYALLAPEKL